MAARRFEHVSGAERQLLICARRLADEHRLLVEPACGAVTCPESRRKDLWTTPEAIAAVTERSDALQGMRSVVLQICGGVGGPMFFPTTS